MIRQWIGPPVVALVAMTAYGMIYRAEDLLAWIVGCLLGFGLSGLIFWLAAVIAKKTVR
jgi:hypothetical protein